MCQGLQASATRRASCNKSTSKPSAPCRGASRSGRVVSGCQKVHYAAFPSGIEQAPGRATSDHTHCLPEGRLPRILFDDPEVPAPCGHVTNFAWPLPKVINKVSQALDAPYETLEDLAAKARLNVDETVIASAARMVDVVFSGRAVHGVKIDPTRAALCC